MKEDGKCCLRLSLDKGLYFLRQIRLLYKFLNTCQLNGFKVCRLVEF